LSVAQMGERFERYWCFNVRKVHFAHHGARISSFL
jgi:hypothetical protein